jgi:hypothetical protein
MLEKFVFISRMEKYLVSISEIKKANFVHQWVEKDTVIKKLLRI